MKNYLEWQVQHFGLVQKFLFAEFTINAKITNNKPKCTLQKKKTNNKKNHCQAKFNSKA